jgi:succinoglycan biosynthesis protein ExoA
VTGLVQPVTNLAPSHKPPVSVIVPIRNEEAYIESCLHHLLNQSYPPDLVTILLIDGRSEDKTRDIITAFQKQHPTRQIHLLDNPKRGVAPALNIGIKAAQTDIVLRMDAHSIPTPDFIEVSVDALETSGASFAGGLVKPVGNTPFSKAAAAAWVHPLVSGGAKFRTATTGQFTDTVFLGALHKNIFDKAGYFNEVLVCNEDYEMNIRIRKAGGTIYLDPRIQTRYAPRSSPKDLWDQYFRYGWWKVETLKLHPESLKIRQLIPFLFVLAVLSLLLVLPFLSIAKYLLAATFIAYGSVLGLATMSLNKQELSMRDILLFPLAVIIMHVSWGSGFLLNLVSGGTFPFRKS